MAIELKNPNAGGSTGEWLESEGVASKDGAIKEKAGAAATQSEAPEANTENEVLPQPGAKSIVERNENIVPITVLRRIEAMDPIEEDRQATINTAFKEVDMSAIQALRKDNQETIEQCHRVGLGLMPFFVKAVINALKQFPPLNAGVRGNDVVFHNYFDIGVAIANEHGLVVPVLRSAEHMCLAEIEMAISDFARRLKEGKFKPDGLDDGSFTITNGGVFGSLLSTPAINPPQTGTLGLHAIQRRPVTFQGVVVIRPMMFLALTYDHRIVNKHDAVLFLLCVKEAIENPAHLLNKV